MGLRFYQQKSTNEALESLHRLRYEHPHRSANTLITTATGGGKTHVEAAIIEALDAPQLAIAHRQELVSQISKALATCGIRHGIMATPETVSAIRHMQIEEIGANYIDQRSHIQLAGINTVLSRATDPFFKRVKYAHVDEGHHIQKTNIWGRGLDLLPTEGIFSYTATARRGDGRGLSRETDGIFDHMVVGPGPRQLMDWGYLTEYRYVCAEPPPDFNFQDIGLSADGDYNKKKLSKAAHDSKRLVGDVVDTYMEYAAGELGITFAVDVEEAHKLAAKFRERGIPAEVVTGKTPDGLRRNILQRFRNKQVLQLINVDLFGEGFDVPAVKIVSLARPTQSFSLYAQQVGRVLRLMVELWLRNQWEEFSILQRRHYIAQSEKPMGIIVDHVNNWITHGMPDNVRLMFDLERRAGRGATAEKDPDLIGLRKCRNTDPVCLRPYEKHLSSCPYCGHTPVPAERTSVEAVEGNVVELDPSILAVLQGRVAQNVAPPQYPYGATDLMRRGIWNRHHEKTLEIQALGVTIATWCAGRSALSERPLSDSEQARAFYHVFGIDVLSAQALGRKDAESLRAKVQRSITIDNVVNIHDTEKMQLENVT